MPLTEDDLNTMEELALDGNSFASIGRKFSVSREYVRQVLLKRGIKGKDLVYDRMMQQLRSQADEVVDLRERYVPPRWHTRGFTRMQYEAFLRKERPDLLSRWKRAKSLPVSYSGHATPHEQFCTMCRNWKLWGEFYDNRFSPFGKSTRCKECSRAQRNVRYDVVSDHDQPVD